MTLTSGKTCKSVRLPIELPCFFLIFGFVFTESVLVNLMMYRTCYLILNYNQSECVLLGSKNPNNNTASLEQLVQPYVTYLVMSKGFLQAILSTIPCFYIGPWSDKYGRKPILLGNSAGYALSHLTITILSALPNASPWYFLLSILPTCLFGGFPALSTVLLSYITDTIAEENRAVRLGVVESVVTVGILIATLSSSFVLSVAGYFVMFSISTCSTLLSFVITLLFIPESVVEVETKNKYRNFFKLSLLKETMRTTFSKRPQHDRLLLLSILGLMTVFMTALTADVGLLFLYLRQKFHWSLEKLTLYASGNHVLGVVSAIMGSYFLHNILRIKESVLIMVGFLCLLCASIIQGLAVADWQVYVAGALTCFASIIVPMARSLVSKIVSAQDCGKVFSLMFIFETLFALAGVPIYTLIYNNTLSTYPGAFNFVTAGIFVFEIMVTIAIIVMHFNRK